MVAPVVLLMNGHRVALCLLAVHLGRVEGHGSLVNPPPRNAVDKDLAPWNGVVPSHPPSVESKTGWCPVPDKDGKPSGQNGQACFCEEDAPPVSLPTCPPTSGTEAHTHHTSCATAHPS